jgi:ABC-type bacteriocin/lantibiotic exporter with double-glycine peptidase domain
LEAPIISVNNISIVYDNKNIISNLSFQLNRGEKVAITGESGRGKTTLLNAITGFVQLSRGEIFWSDKKLEPENITEIRSNIAWLPQETALYFNNISEIIYTPFTFKSNKVNYPTTSMINQMFSEFNLSPDIINKKIDEISGGQKQRILLATALLLKKPILIIDEPTSNLDENNKKRITDYVLSQKNLTVIAASHDPYWIEKTDRIISL